MAHLVGLMAHCVHPLCGLQWPFLSKTMCSNAQSATKMTFNRRALPPIPYCNSESGAGVKCSSADIQWNCDLHKAKQGATLARLRVMSSTKHTTRTVSQSCSIESSLCLASGCLPRKGLFCRFCLFFLTDNHWASWRLLRPARSATSTVIAATVSTS